MKNSDYWKERFELLENQQFEETAAYYRDLQRQFQKAQFEIQEKIEHWLYRIADNNEISRSEARKFLNESELEEFKWSLEEYIEHGKENSVNQQWMKELENASAKVHIQKLEAMQLQMRAQAERLFVNYEKGVGSFLGKSYESVFYKTAHEVAKGTGIGKNIPALDQSKIDMVIRKTWAQDGTNFSDKIWNNKQKLVRELHTELTQNVIRGENPQKAAKRIAEKMGVSERHAKRLVYTESAAIATKAREDCFNNLGVEKYEIVATLDSKTSDICQAMDGEFFDMKDYEVGVTAPPFHPNCRSCTCPHFDDEFTEGEQRAARGSDGKTYHVPADMKYKDWHKEYVENNPEELLKEKMTRNHPKDAEQYSKYKKALGKDHVPKDLDEFQRMKYTDSAEYGILKAQYKGMSYYDKAVKNEPIVTEQVKSIAKQSGMSTEGLKYRIKSKDSYLRKIRSNYSPDGNQYEIKDILRYTYSADAKTVTDKTLKAFEIFQNNGYNISEVKNYWFNKNNPYNGINTVVATPSGQKFEVQYHTSESYRIKDSMHEDYEKWRVLDKSSPEAVALRKRMHEQSNEMTRPANIGKVKK